MRNHDHRKSGTQAARNSKDEPVSKRSWAVCANVEIIHTHIYKLNTYVSYHSRHVMNLVHLHRVPVRMWPYPHICYVMCNKRKGIHRRSQNECEKDIYINTSRIFSRIVQKKTTNVQRARTAFIRVQVKNIPINRLNARKVLKSKQNRTKIKNQSLIYLFRFSSTSFCVYILFSIKSLHFWINEIFIAMQEFIFFNSNSACGVWSRLLEAHSIHFVCCSHRHTEIVIFYLNMILLHALMISRTPCIAR